MSKLQGPNFLWAYFFTRARGSVGIVVICSVSLDDWLQSIHIIKYTFDKSTKSICRVTVVFVLYLIAQWWREIVRSINVRSSSEPTESRLLATLRCKLLWTIDITLITLNAPPSSKAAVSLHHTSLAMYSLFPRKTIFLSSDCSRLLALKGMT